MADHQSRQSRRELEVRLTEQEREVGRLERSLKQATAAGERQILVLQKVVCVCPCACICVCVCVCARTQVCACVYTCKTLKNIYQLHSVALSELFQMCA